jgi:hypothetical protein
MMESSLAGKTTLHKIALVLLGAFIVMSASVQFVFLTDEDFQEWGLFDGVGIGTILLASASIVLLLIGKTKPGLTILAIATGFQLVSSLLGFSVSILTFLPVVLSGQLLPIGWLNVTSSLLLPVSAVLFVMGRSSLTMAIPARLEARKSQIAPILSNNEELLAENGAFALLTNERFIQLNLAQQVKQAVPLDAVERISTTRKMLAKAGPLILHTSEGLTYNFGILHDVDWGNFQEVFASAKDGQNSVDDKKSSKSIASEAQMERVRGEMENSNDFGGVAAQGGFGSKIITIYKNGFIQINKNLGFTTGNIEKLIQIDGDSQIWKKTGLGRAAASVITLGMNRAAPNQRGNLTLTITTDREVYVFLEEMPYPHYIKAMHELVNAGKAAIELRDKKEGKKTTSETSSVKSLGEQINKLVQLKESGVLTEAEFESAKTKLLA